MWEAPSNRILGKDGMRLALVFLERFFVCCRVDIRFYQFIQFAFKAGAALNPDIEISAYTVKVTGVTVVPIKFKLTFRALALQTTNY